MKHYFGFWYKPAGCDECGSELRKKILKVLQYKFRAVGNNRSALHTLCYHYCEKHMVGGFHG